MRPSRNREQPGVEYASIKDMPSADRPRERLLQFGANSLSVIELIAILLRTGSTGRPVLDVAHDLLTRFGGLRQLQEASVAQISATPGVGEAKAILIKAALELGRRAEGLGKGEVTVINDPNDVFQLLGSELRNERREFFYAVLLNTKNVVIKKTPISIGTLDMSVVSPRELFREAIREGAASVIVAHNHPSGDPTPSFEDIAVTRRLQKAGQLVGIELLDHIILGDNQFVSLKAKGHL